MKMHDVMDLKMLATCGMNCIVCYKYLITKNVCNSCKYDGDILLEHCQKCKIKD